MDEQDELQDATKATWALVREVRTFNQRFTALNTLNRRTRNTMWALVGIIAIMAVFGGHQLHSNHRAQVVGCQNANEMRAAQLAVWDFVLGYELADGSDSQAPAETEMSKIILPYMHEIWKQRDCNDLDRPYPLPDPPTPPPPAGQE